MAVTHAQAQLLLPALALDAVDASERLRLLAHVKSCGRCQTALARFRAAAAGMADATAPLAPPPALRARLLASLAPQAAPRLTRASHGGLVDGLSVQGTPLLADGSRIQAAPGGRLEVQFPGQAVAVLMDGAKARLQRLSRQWQLRLEAGQALFEVQAGQRFRTWTPLATVQVKGTWYFARVDSPDQAYVCLCEGWIGLQGPGLKRDLKAGREGRPQHQAVQLTRHGRRTLCRPASPKHPHPATGPILSA
jgi:ferric-dicitrate binding protein FerR (iron transport regulator)